MDLIGNKKVADQWEEALSGIAQDADKSSGTELLLAFDLRMQTPPVSPPHETIHFI